LDHPPQIASYIVYIPEKLNITCNVLRGNNERARR